MGPAACHGVRRAFLLCPILVVFINNLKSDPHPSRALPREPVRKIERWHVPPVLGVENINNLLELLTRMKS